MGQQEVIKFLEKQNDPMTSGEVAKKMNECPKKICAIIRKLLKFHEIETIEIDRMKAKERCGSRRRVCLYYIKRG